ncbi:11-oxo-beta-amyrin 30-oxidase [Ananas comosus]|uniref:11-oxo-beta-amyrin 30-oxidase n=1 Tax=Ananas comosus TaxID=4615 RepID=A0A199W0K6_ANACO|nr:11-oxo-beta-amyrin 30-oxidase [Ananas comosus]
MAEACDAAVPYILLGLLLPGGAAAPAPPGGSAFLRAYAARVTNALLWAALLAVTFLLVRRLAGLVKLWIKGSQIPGPPSSTPFFGRGDLVAACGSGADLSGYLSKLHHKYGPIVRLWLGPTQLLVSVKDTGLINEVLMKAEDKLPLTGKAYQLAFGRSSLFASSFEQVKKGRESLAEYLNAKLDERTNLNLVKVVETILGRVDSIMAKGFLDCRVFAQHIAFYILGATIFGEAFLDWPNSTMYEELLMMVAKDGCFWASCKVPPFWSVGYWRYHLLCAKLKHLTREIVQLYRCNYSTATQDDLKKCTGTQQVGEEIRTESTSLLNNVISGSFIQCDIDGYLCSQEEPCGNILGLMFHGSLAIASLIGGVITRLVLHPELQGKLYSEIIATRKRNSQLETSDVQNTQLLLSTVYESARLLPAGPLLQRCSLEHDLSLKSSITLPAGAILVVPLQLVQMDYSIWGNDACEFNPCRFLSKATGLKDGNSEIHESGKRPFVRDPNKNAAFLPFGSGTRACVGQKFALHSISRVLAYLLQNYEIRLQPGVSGEPKPTMDDCILQLLPSPKIVLKRRSEQ